MYLDLPVEQLIRHEGMPFQFAFATEAKELVPEREDFLLKASHKGLHVMAKNEDSLVLPLEVLRQVYGASLHVDAPRVRLIEGVQLLEPIMHVRISLRMRFRELVKNALKRRRVVPSEEYARSTYCVLRYEAALADLLGLPAELGRLTGGGAKYWIVLSHYAVVTRDPGGKAA
jgi:Elongation factor G C-terminus